MELVAHDDDEYVDRAVGLVRNLDRLQTVRSGLRQKFLASPVMDSAGFVLVRGGTGISGIGGGGQAVVLLSGTSRPPAVDPGLFMAPLAAALVEAQRPVAAAETETTLAPFVTLLRDDGSLDGRLVTVDDADNMAGRLALVLGLRDLLASPGKGGDYGVKAGASALLPKP